MKQDEIKKQLIETLDAWIKEIGDIQAVGNVLEIILQKLTWDQMLLTLSNRAFRTYEKQGDSRLRKKWRERCHILHDAMESEKAKHLHDKLIQETK